MYHRDYNIEMQYKTTIAQKPERGKRVKEFKCPYIALDIVI